MAGHRRTRPDARPRRPVRQHSYWRDRIAAAVTSEQLFDIAADWLRAVTSCLPDDRRTAVLNEAGQHLAGKADELARKR